MSAAVPPSPPIPARSEEAAANPGDAWLKGELAAIAARAGGPPPPLFGAAVAPGSGAADGRGPASHAGLALSGGGIRSASVCLGVLQALDRDGLLARLDAGAEFHLDTRNLQRQADGLSRAHLCTGQIRYRDGRIGSLIYVKATITGDEPPDVRAYRDQNPVFPHETTADQFFSEAQFEAYRALGEHIGGQIGPVLDAACRRHA